MDTARKLTVLLVPLLFGLFLVPSVPVRATTEFTFRGFKGNKSAIRIAGEAAVIKPDGLLRLTNRASNVTGTAFYHKPVRLLETNRIATRVGSFSTRFVFVIIPSSSSSGGFGFTFTLSPTPNRPNAGSAQYLGVLNKENNGDPRNHVFAVEFDTVQGSGDDTDKIGNDIGLNFNNRTSDFQEPVVYYQKDDPNKREDFELESGNPIQALLSYDGATQTLNVTIPKLLDVVQEEMYVGFTAATGKGDQSSDHYLMGWSFSSVGENPIAATLDLSELPPPPRFDSGFIGRYGHHACVALLLRHVQKATATRRDSGRLGNRSSSQIQIQRSLRSHRRIQGGWDHRNRRFRNEDHSKQQARCSRIYGGDRESRAREASKPRESPRMVQTQNRSSADLRLHPQRQLGLAALQCSTEKRRRFAVERAFRDRQRNRVGFVVSPRRVGTDRGSQRRETKQRSDRIQHEPEIGRFRTSEALRTRIADRDNGTIGYVAPELARNGKPSSASDAYAFGVLLLEIVCGRKPTDSGTFFLVDWVMGLHARGEILSAIDPRLGSDYDGEEARVALAVGLLCCHQNPASRPSMRGVLRFLNGEIDGDWGYSKSSRSDFGSKFVPSSSSKASSSSSFVTRITSTSRVTSGG
ncbi:unnamed protein product [Brassica oleracea var. botrytis]|uniref:Protein kinase domain-containing protein n=2 Tax=Brassica oleracea TaxID=3712 RepID=A0A0D3AZA5_BRAOL|nr:unnamed protein product [Brassica oleracea]